VCVCVAKAGILYHTYASLLASVSGSLGRKLH
jgi:hypothetical protein